MPHSWSVLLYYTRGNNTVNCFLRTYQSPPETILLFLCWPKKKCVHFGHTLPRGSRPYGAMYHMVHGCYPSEESTSFPPNHLMYISEICAISEMYKKQKERPAQNLRQDRHRLPSLFFRNSPCGLRQPKKQPLRSPDGLMTQA